MKIIGDIMTPLFPIFQCDYWKQKVSFYFLILIVLLFVSFNVNGQAALSGKVTDADTGETILFGDIVVYQNGKLITGEQTDFDGNYIISPIDTGTYEVVFKYVGYQDVKVEKVEAKSDKETNLDIAISQSKNVNAFEGCRHPIPMIRADDFDKGQSFTSDEIRNLPNKN